MAQFCTRCGKPLTADVRFCPACGGAVAVPATPATGTPSQVSSFSPVTGATEDTAAASTAWSTVAAPAEPAPPSQWQSPQPTPVDVPANATPPSNQSWASTAAPNGSGNGNGASAPPQPPAWTQTASAASTPNPQWSQQGQATSIPSQWSQASGAFPASGSIGTPMQPKRSGSLIGKLIGIALVLILLAGVVVVGGVVYVGYKVKQKAHAVSQNLSKLSTDQEMAGLKKGVDGLTKAGSSPDMKQALQGLSELTKNGGSPDGLKGALEGLAGALGKAVTHSDGLPVLSSSDPTVPCEPASFPSQNKARIPFKPGTVLTTAWGIKYGDVEARNTIDGIDDSTVSTTNITPEYKDDNGSTARATTILNRNCNSDYRATDSYITVNSTQMPRMMHDLTRYRLSDKCFREIKSTGRTSFTYVDIWHVPNGVKLTHQGGTLTRVEAGDVKYPMIVNDQRVELPAIHLRGNMLVPEKDPRPENLRPKASPGELFVLDDPADPLVLNWRLKDPLFHNGNFRVEVVKISFPVAKPENVLEKQLTQVKRAVTYGIYFDFNKDTLKPESAPVLKEIADAMTHNPDWKLTVEGHTDNIGGDTYNLDLSKRRAAAVKQALVSEYNIAGDRLLTNGFGASRPVGPNDTLEGRARNRRVELVRQ